MKTLIRESFAAVLAAFTFGLALAAVFAQEPPGRRFPPTDRDDLLRRLTIEQKYSALGGARGTLGAPRSPETSLPDRAGRYRLHANGIILWHPDTGAHELHGAIYQKFLSLGPAATPGSPRFLAAPLASLGYPITDERNTEDRRGAYNAFQRGVIYYIRDLVSDLETTGGAHEIHGDIYEKWKALYHAGFDLGYPLTDETATPDRRGRFNHFERGSIYWTRATGAHEVHGDIRARWAQTGWERGPLGYPTADERDAPGGGRVSDFERGSIRWRVVPSRLSFIQYNAALLPRVVADIGVTRVVVQDEYRGKNRRLATDALIANLRRESADIVGLSELFISSDYISEFRRLNSWSGYLDASNDRQRIKDALADIYPHMAEIPVAGTGTFEVDLQDPLTTLDMPRATELLLLSKWPITARNHQLYRDAAGDDTKAGKGILHARVQPPGHLTQYDIFVTHTQNPDEGDSETEKRRSRDALARQLDQIAGFIATHSSPDRPALLMGDLNVDGNNTARRLDLMRRLERPASLEEPFDLWARTRDGAPGITDDHGLSTFARGTAGAPASDPRRGRSGKRIDWFLGWRGTRFWPTYENTQVLMWQFSGLRVAPGTSPPRAGILDVVFGDGHDVSDHYGLKAEQVNLRELTMSVRVPVR